MEKKIIHTLLGEITLRKRVANRSIRISVHPQRPILVTLPFFCSYSEAVRFVESKSDWIEKVRQKQAQREIILRENGLMLPSPSTASELEALRRKARAILVPRLNTLALENGFVDRDGAVLFHRVAIKNNRSNWGSCSGRDNINLNMKLVMLPQRLQDYVLLHELCHLRYHNHSAEFHKLLDSLLGGEEKSLQKELRSWRLI